MAGIHGGEVSTRVANGKLQGSADKQAWLIGVCICTGSVHRCIPLPGTELVQLPVIALSHNPRVVIHCCLRRGQPLTLGH